MKPRSAISSLRRHHFPSIIKNIHRPFLDVVVAPSASIFSCLTQQQQQQQQQQQTTTSSSLVCVVRLI
jgi:hypothetical protein